jgi:hypothetical protein
VTLKIDLLMSLNGQTFSESHYLIGADQLPIPSYLITPLAAARAQCLGAGGQITGIRCSTVPASRITQDFFFDELVYAPSWPPDLIGGTYDATIPNDAILLRLSAATFTSAPDKSLYLAAPPSVAIRTRGGNPRDLGSNANFNTALGRYMYLLTGNNVPNTLNAVSPTPWAYRVRDQTAEFQGLAPVTNAGFPGMIGVPTYSQLPNVGFAQGDTHEIYITGYRRINPRIPGLSGAWTVGGITAPVPPATFPWTYYLMNSGNVSPSNFSSIGQVAPLKFLYPNYGPFWSVDKAVTRKRGESIGARRGRSRTRA